MWVEADAENIDNMIETDIFPPGRDREASRQGRSLAPPELPPRGGVLRGPGPFCAKRRGRMPLRRTCSRSLYASRI
jgi:hypothetical protein